MKKNKIALLSLLCAVVLMLGGCGAGAALPDAADQSGENMAAHQQGSFELRDDSGTCVLSAAELAAARVVAIDVGAASSAYAVELSFTADGAKKYADYVAAHLGETLTAYADGKPLDTYKIPRMIPGDTLLLGQYATRQAAQTAAAAILGEPREEM